MREKYKRISASETHRVCKSQQTRITIMYYINPISHTSNKCKGFMLPGTFWWPCMLICCWHLFTPMYGCMLLVFEIISNAYVFKKWKYCSNPSKWQWEYKYILIEQNFPLGNQDNRFIAIGVLGHSHVWLHVTKIGKSKSVLKLSLEQEAS